MPNVPPRVTFETGDLKLFAEASHDRNPLHLNPDYARRTAFGEPVVFGVLGALAAMGRSALPRELIISALTLEFSRPLFCDVDYRIEERKGRDGRIVIQLMDGSNVILRVIITPGDATSNPKISNPNDGFTPTTGHEDILTESCVLTDEQLSTAQTTKGVYAPGNAALRELATKLGLNESVLQIAPFLLATSYIVGMRIPGRRALYSKLRLHFGALPGASAQLPKLHYSVTSDALDPRHGILQLRLFFEVGGNDVAQGVAWTFARIENIACNVALLDSAIPRSDLLAGRVAFVVGGSRGLGAAIVAALALQGCTVVSAFQRSAEAALELKDSLPADVRDRIVLRQGDAANLSWLMETREWLQAQFGSLDFLICSACPRVLPLRLEPDSASRFTTYLQEAMPLVSTPMAALLDLLRPSGGWNILISSIYAESGETATPGSAGSEYPHYVALKRAVEGLALATFSQQPATRLMIARPPVLATDMTSGAKSPANALAPETFASRIVLRLLAATPDDRYALIR